VNRDGHGTFVLVYKLPREADMAAISLWLRYLFAHTVVGNQRIKLHSADGRCRSSGLIGTLSWHIQAVAKHD
jgi:hypothetical protein